MAVMVSAYIHDPLLEKHLRRLCRNEAADPKLQTMALQSLFWSDTHAKVKLLKRGQVYTVDTEQPVPSLHSFTETPLQSVHEEVERWFTDVAGLTDREAADYPHDLLAEAGGMLEQVFLYYYPEVEVPVEQLSEYAAALLHLLWEDAARVGREWSYPEPAALSVPAQERKEWMAKSLGLNDRDKEDPLGFGT
jgi:hypothetical protein